ncbi:hypothetical protein NCCP2140_24410 [Pseudoalteromonas sp. NCCP-2140]|uniref:sigma-54 interaction domain-containing protein n=1 Tax=Pseudoalteromonas sp. NCCP-2140 TaxID=2942288 RepID=UPI00203DE5F6|nr:sigma-54 dependent transcriptional regulator [Pseudoalteromonas sp. NCCP-2140]GKW53388.1 hypothetical protein NCCP2140_24410 [Pseudoalteromonas sp. NCCP-2140]
MNTLYTWIGNTDIKNMQQDEHAAISTIALQNPKAFDRIFIFANDWENDWKPYEKWLGKRLREAGRPFDNVAIFKANIEGPTDYPTIIRETEKWVSKLSEESEELYINITSGTPAMSVASVLVGKGKHNTHFIQSNRDNTIENVDVPVDFGQAYVKSAAKSIADKAVKAPSSHKQFDNIIAQSQVMQSLISKAKRVAESELELPALVLGETGTGKEVIANAIHAASPRSGKPLKTVNCGALPESLVDSILFGHVKGAFTGANEKHEGLFEQANGGTLFLDEVGELMPSVQVKLLRALQQGEITRVGDKKTISVDVRIIAATHRDLQQLVEQGEFREDLFYRLAVGLLHIPPLRERHEDIEPLVLELVDELNQAANKYPGYKSKNISEKGIKFIKSQPWHGNIRELWNTINRAFLWSDKEKITDVDIKNALIVRSPTTEESDVVLSLGQQVDIHNLVEKYKKKYVEAAMKAAGNNKTKAAKMIGLKSQQVITKWIEALGIETQ